MKSGILAFAVVLSILTLSCGVKKNDLTAPEDPTVVGSVSTEMTTYYPNMARCETGFGKLVADIMVYKGINADMAFINAGTIRRRDTNAPTSLGPGDITRGALTLVFPFDNPDRANPSTIYMISLTGVVIKEVLENGLSKMQSDGTPGASYGRFLQVSGIKVYADVTNPVNSRVTAVTLKDGTPIDLTDSATTFRAAIPSKYIKDSPGNADWDGYWDIFAKGTNAVDTKITLYDATVEVFQTFSPLSYGEPALLSPPVLGDCLPPNTERLYITHN